MTARVFNFASGPAVLPEPVLEQVRDELTALPGVGISILELSHRSAAFEQIRDRAEERLRRVLEVPADYQVLFLQGGAQLQFSMVPMSFLRGSEHSAAYVITGSWGHKAAEQARLEGKVEVAWDGAAANYRGLPGPGEPRLGRHAYVHYTSNETIQGVQFQDALAAAGNPLVCDASSDFLSRPIEVAKYDLIYACAQKNAGPAGLTIVVVADRLLERRARNLPAMLDYAQYAQAKSLLNTPNCFAVYVFELVLRWLEQQGGLAAIAQRNARKAARLYQVIDQDGGRFYRGHADPSCRSLMNVTFRLANAELERAFLADAQAAGLVELKGHRSVGGMRASIYNAMPEAGVERLRQHLIDFRARHA